MPLKAAVQDALRLIRQALAKAPEQAVEREHGVAPKLGANLLGLVEAPPCEADAGAMRIGNQASPS